MDLTPEERQRIYEEESVRLEARNELRRKSRAQILKRVAIAAACATALIVVVALLPTPEQIISADPMSATAIDMCRKQPAANIIRLGSPTGVEKFERGRMRVYFVGAVFRASSGLVVESDLTCTVDPNGARLVSFSQR